MNQVTIIQEAQEMEKHSWLFDKLIAIVEKLAYWILPSEMGMYDYDTQVFMSYYGFTVEEFMSNPARANHYQDMGV